MSSSVLASGKPISSADFRLHLVRTARELETSAFERGLARLNVAIRNGLSEEILLEELFIFATEQTRLRSITANAVSALSLENDDEHAVS